MYENALRLGDLPSRRAHRNVSRLHALIPAAGHGHRAGTARPKQFEPLNGEPLLVHTLRAFAGVSRVDQVLVVLAPGEQFVLPAALVASSANASFYVANCGGNTRADSVLNGLNALADGVAGLPGAASADDWVLVHDAARCLVTPTLIDRLIDACLADLEQGAVGGLLALPLADTLKQAGPVQRSVHATDTAHSLRTLDRTDKWLAQTPQMFRLGPLRAALAQALAHDAGAVTDEASAIERAGQAPLLVRGSATNIKLTWPEDFALAAAILRSRTP